MSLVLAVLKKYNLQAKPVKGGKELLLCCPFGQHTDRTPSLYIEASTGRYHCFGCKIGGNSMESFVEKLTGEKVDLSELITPAELLKFKMNKIYESSFENISQIPATMQRSQDIQNIFDTFDIIERHSEAMDYLTGPKRKLTPETIRKAKLRFCTHGEYQNRIIIPYYQGTHMLGFNARLLGTDKQIGKELRYRYLLNESIFDGYIYNLENSSGNTCILVEGPFDLMYTEQCGFKNVVSTLSTRVSPKHIGNLARFSRFIFIFDNDEKKNGEEAVMKASKLILNNLPDREVLFCKLPDYKDPNECSKKELWDSVKNLKRITIDAPKKSIQFRGLSSTAQV